VRIQGQARFGPRSRLALILIGPSALLAGLEVCARLFTPRPFFHPDVLTLYSLDTQGAWQRQQATINPLGYRGEAVAPRTSHGPLRILALGGSTTFGYLLRDQATWPVLLEQQLEDAGESIEIINGGVTGWGLGQCVERLVRDGARIQPDLLMIYTGWNFPGLDFAHSFNPFPYPAQWIHSFPHWLLESRLFLSLAKRMGELRKNPVAAGGANPVDRAVHFQRQFERLARWSEIHRTPVLLILIPALVSTTTSLTDLPILLSPLRVRWPSPGQAEEEVFAEAQGHHREALQALRTAAKRHGFVLLDADSHFSRLTATERVPLFQDRMHLTERGSTALAEILGRQLQQLPHPRRRGPLLQTVDRRAH
jgi:lysophospholipase L1-like esterase